MIMSTKKIKFPFEIKPVETKLNEELKSYFKGVRSSFIQVGPQKCLLTKNFEEELPNIYNFEARKDDVWIISYPRTGTTLTHEMIWFLCNNLDDELAEKIPVRERFAFLEFKCLFDQELIQEWRDHDNNQSLEQPNYRILLEKSTQRRFIKTHLPLSLLPKNLLEVGCKIVYVARNPKNVAVSNYHLNKMIRSHNYIGDFKRYWHYFKRDLTLWAPFWEHVKGGWSVRNHPNVQFFFYEELVKNLRGGIEQMDKFLETNQSEDNIEKLSKYLSFENFKTVLIKSNHIDEYMVVPGEQQFVRKGKNGGFEEYFDDELDKEANEWIDSNLKNSDLKFPNF